MKKIIYSLFLLCIGMLQACQGNMAKSYTAIDLSGFSDVIKHWDDQHPDDHQGRYSQEQIIHIADNILLYQRANGGWPENKNPLRIIPRDEIKQQQALFNSLDTSLDNRNVYPQIRYLADVYQQTNIDKYRDAALRGLQFILASQLANGGFTHSPPRTDMYHGYITFMDDVMPGVLGLLQEIKLGSKRFNFVPATMVRAIAQAHQRGDELLLRLQIRVDGRPSVWAGQYDPVTLEPETGRSFELPSLVSRESVDVVRYLMSDPAPSMQKIHAIQAAIAWFERAKLPGLDMVQIEAEPVRYKFHTSTWDRVMVQNPSAKPLWARFYDLQTNQPLLVTREGVRVQQLAQIDRERRTGYDWYGRWPEKLLMAEYPAWLRQHGKSGDYIE